METLEQIKSLAESLSVDTEKFYKGNKSAGTRARKSAGDVSAAISLAMVVHQLLKPQSKPQIYV